MAHTPHTQSTPNLIDAAIAEYGALRVLFQTLITVIIFTKPRPLSVDELDNRLRQDIGLPPKIPEPNVLDLMR